MGQRRRIRKKKDKGNTQDSDLLPLLFGEEKEYGLKKGRGKKVGEIFLPFFVFCKNKRGKVNHLAPSCRRGGGGGRAEGKKKEEVLPGSVRHAKERGKEEGDSSFLE